MSNPALVARLAVYVVVVPWIVVCLSDATRGGRLYVALAVAIALACRALLRYAPGWLARPWPARVDLVLWNATLAFLMLEAGMRLYLAIGNPPAWFTVMPEQAKYRLDPAREWLGHRPNSQGFYDSEFSPERSPDVIRVVALGDSYAVGIVPYPENYLTVIDAALGEGIEILNLGVVHMAVRQYLEVLQSDGLALRPDVVLLGIYIGNDIRPDPPRGLFSRHGSVAITIMRRVAAVTSAADGQARPFEDLFRHEPDGTRTEIPVMTVEKHHEREWKHLQHLFGPPRDTRTKRSWRDTERALRELVELCRDLDIPVVATLAPDEIQVSSSVFERVTAAYGAKQSDFDLGYPGRRLSALLEDLGVPTLDLTPALVEAEASAPTYHPRAVHWNRHGNAAVARRLTPWLREQLTRLGP